MNRTMKTFAILSLLFGLLMAQKPAKAQGSDTTRYMLHVIFVQYDGSSADAGITLRWSTILETNLATYVIERSNGNEVFEEVGTITAKGSSSVSVSYSFTDANPKRGINIYRLKLVDTRGGAKYSEYKQFSWTKSILTSAGIKSYPNPAPAGSAIQVEVSMKGKINIQLLNMKGARYNLTQATVGSHGNLSYQLPGRLEKGMYILVVTNDDNESFQTKILVM